MFFKNKKIHIDKNKKTVIFDFDGTIADTFELLIDILDGYQGDFGVEIADRETIQRLTGKSAKDVIKELNIPFFLVPFVAYKIKNDMHDRKERIRPFNEVINQIKSLRKDFNIGILSNNNKKNINYFIKKYNLQDNFDFVVPVANTFGKQHALKKLLKDNNLSNEDVVYIGDEAKDIEACKIADIKIVSVAWGFNNINILKENNKIVINDQKLLAKTITDSFK